MPLGCRERLPGRLITTLGRPYGPGQVAALPRLKPQIGWWRAEDLAVPRSVPHRVVEAGGSPRWLGGQAERTLSAVPAALGNLEWV